MEELGAMMMRESRPSSSPPGAASARPPANLTVAVNLSTHEIDRP